VISKLWTKLQPGTPILESRLHVDRDSNPFNLCHHIAKVLEHPRAPENAHKRRAAEEKKEATAKRRKLKFGMSAAQLKALNKKLAKVPTRRLHDS